MASVTTWTRIEPRSRSDDLLPSLEARVADPAWLLGRQWQVGEFVDEDCGTPIWSSMTVQTAPIVSYGAGDAAEGVAVPADLPWEVLAGAEPPAAMTAAESAYAGLELIRMLGEAGCSATGVDVIAGPHRLASPVPGAAGSEGLDLLGLLTGRAPDGAALAPVMAVIASTSAVPLDLDVPLDDHQAVIDAATAWIGWLTASRATPSPAGAWQDDRLEHRFRMGVQPPQGAAFALRAPAWDGDRLDWFDLDVDHRAAAPARPPDAPDPVALPGVDPATSTVSVAGVPAPLTYPGMPLARWWAFEDAAVNLAEITVSTSDLARLLILEFASVYSNDWYLWPLVLPVGAMHTVSELAVTDTFGDTFTISPAGAGEANPDWQLFRPTQRQANGSQIAHDGLLLPPAIAGPVTGEPFEQVLFLRDEQANLAWAIEESVLGADGRPLDRHSVAAASDTGLLAAPRPPPVPDPASDTSPLRYDLETDVPVYWFPLAPADNRSFRVLLPRRVDRSGAVYRLPPQGRLLTAGQMIRQEEVPREGARAIRRDLLARGSDGRLHVWRGRLKQTGRGEGSSGMRYDSADPVAGPDDGGPP